jgi:Uma2 family endonuclease
MGWGEAVTIVDDSLVSPLVGERMSLADFLALPEAEVALEFEDGVVMQKMAPSGPHGMLEGHLTIFFADFDSADCIVDVLPETRLTIAGVSRVPDLIVFLGGRVPLDDDGNVATHFFTPPDIAVEIVSPGQSSAIQRERCREYARIGVRAAICVDPERREIYVARRSGESGPFAGDSSIELSDLIPGCILVPDSVFACLRGRRPRGQG